MPSLAPGEEWEPWEKGLVVPRVGHPPCPVPSRQARRAIQAQWEGDGHTIQPEEKGGTPGGQGYAGEGY